jgi:hypothetical protein
MTDMGKKQAEARRLPPQLWTGVTLVALAWPLDWLLPGLRTHILFFPLWLGYALTVDGLVLWRTGTSLLARSWRAYTGLFFTSAPAWWLFEVINSRTQNWQYVGREHFSDGQYFLLASLSFSTVMPSVFGTAELIGSFQWIKRIRPGVRVQMDRLRARRYFLTGLVMLALLIAWPRVFFPLVWVSVYFIVDPINFWLGHRTLAATLAAGDWRPILALWVGTLTCGFFWEMWNYWSYPRWIYHVPFVDVAHIFEMPMLGYGGYLPFGMELFAVYYLVTGLLGLNLRGYITLD